MDKKSEKRRYEIREDAIPDEEGGDETPIYDVYEVYGDGSEGCLESFYDRAEAERYVEELKRENAEDAPQQGCKRKESEMGMRVGNMNKDNKYYAVFAEWLYPTESGRDFVGDYDTLEDALAACEEACDKEFENYMKACGCDALWPCQYSDYPSEPPKGWTITAANGLDEWWYAAKIVPITYGE